jgi:hypothetical protein
LTPIAPETREAPPQAEVRAYRLELECAVAILLMALGCMGRTQLFMLEHPGALSWDEGYMGALAARLIDTQWLPGVYAVSQRGPILYWLMTLTQWLGGWDSWIGIRTLAWIVPTITVCSVFALGLIFRRPLVGAFAVVLFAFVLGVALVTGDGIGINGEHVIGMFEVLALTAIAEALRRERRALAGGRVLVFVAGVLSACAGFSKQIALPTSAVLVLWLLVRQAEPSLAERRARLQRAGIFIAGWLLVAVLCVLPYAIGGYLTEFWYNFYRYNTEIFLAPYKVMPLQRELAGWFMDNPFPVGTMFLIAGLAAAEFVRQLRGLDRGSVTKALKDKAFELVVLAHFLIALVTMIIQMKWWHHQMVALLPFLGLLFALRVDVALRVGTRLGRTLALLLQTGLALLFLFVSYDAKMLRLQRERGAAGLWRSAVPDPICDKIQKHSKPSDRIYVWGFDGDVYVSCKRRPATRYVYSTMVAGIVPPFWNEWHPERVAWRARENTVEDLKQNRPKLFVDMPAKLGNLSMVHIPEIREYILENKYCDLGGVEGKLGRIAQMWMRPDAGQKCPKIRFPRPAAAATAKTTAGTSAKDGSKPASNAAATKGAAEETAADEATTAPSDEPKGDEKDETGSGAEAEGSSDEEREAK